jgi:hypothetical protein
VVLGLGLRLPVETLGGQNLLIAKRGAVRDGMARRRGGEPLVGLSLRSAANWTERR